MPMRRLTSMPVPTSGAHAQAHATDDADAEAEAEADAEAICRTHPSLTGLASLTG